jgi:nitrous-oxide reductase
MKTLLWSALAISLAWTGLACTRQAEGAGMGGGAGLAALMKARNLSEADVSAALKTYTPGGKPDEYYLFASGGQSGSVLVMGVPSMRILKYIAVFSPEPWQGYGYGDESNKLLESGKRDGRAITWGDMHHPALSETKGDYDGQFLFVNDKANPRVAVISLSDFTTKQLVTSQLIQSEHGSTMVTPDTEYVIETAQYPAPLGGGYADLSEFNEKYRGAAIFWKFDRQQGRIIPAASWAVELPPYMQDLADAGKLDSSGWAFFNSFDTERSYGGNLEGKPSLESGASQNDMDYLHLFNWKKAEQVVAAGKTKTIAGMRVIPLQTAIDEGLLYFVGEPKSPHGCDVTPDGKEIVVGGKLDTHTTVYSFAKLQALIASKTFDGRDPYGVPILPYAQAIRGQVEVGLGPLHTQFDNQGFAYTSLFIESKVAKWSLKDLKLVEKIPVHYNIGHLVTAEGDTVSPDGKYLVAMDKWSLDRFNPVGPLLPQNFQLIETDGPTMQLLYELPIPLGEPHYAQMIKADKIKPLEIYRPTGFNPITDQHDPNAVEGGKERVERRADGVHVYMSAIRSHFIPDIIRVKEGERVHLHLTSLEQARDATHGFTIDNYNLHVSLEPGKHENIDFVADRSGVFPFYCTEFCSALHLEMAGYLLVEPKK